MTRHSLLLVVVLGMGLATAGTARAGQAPAEQTLQTASLTSEQVVLDCTIAGVAVSAATTLGLLKPMTVALHTMPAFAFLQEAVYGCGIGVIGGYVGQTLAGLVPAPPAPSPFASQNAALPSTTADSR